MPEVPYEVPVKAYRGRTAHGPASSAPQQPPPQATVTHPEPAQPPRDGAPGAEAPHTEAPHAEAQVAVLPMPLRPAWLRNHVPSPDPGQKPTNAGAVDDMGCAQNRTANATALRRPVPPR